MSIRRPLVARFLVAGVLLGFCVPAAWSVERRASYLAALDSIAADKLQQHVNYLASDELEGREAGTPGGYAAGDYVALRLAALRLRGSGADGGYFQTFSPNFRNVLAAVEGSDAPGRGDVIVVGAHYDHIGRGRQGNTRGQVGAIHPGADDNASGTSGLLELAHAFTILAEPPRRTVLFAFWDAEEKGMLGSKHWIDHPTIARDRVRLLVNVDMIGRLRDERLMVFGTRSGTGLRRLVSTHNGPPVLRLEFPWTMLPNADHFPFFSHSIPFITLHTDLHDQYHKPADKADLINAAGMRRVVRLLFSMVYDAANADEMPAFRAASQHESEETRRSLARQTPQLPERLGTGWEKGVSAGPGILLASVSAQSPAQRADLRPGDRILQFAGRPIGSSDDLIGAIQTAPARTTALVLRSGESTPGPLRITLDGEPLRIGIAWRIDDAEPGTAVLTYVVSGSPAARAGLRIDDRIYQAGGRGFTSDAEFSRLLGTLPSPIRIQFERNGQVQDAELQIEPPRLRRAA
jgi:membrane-associated protease RseP (regulator of RpoE activity)